MEVVRDRGRGSELLFVARRQSAEHAPFIQMGKFHNKINIQIN